MPLATEVSVVHDEIKNFRIKNFINIKNKIQVIIFSILKNNFCLI